MAKAKPKKKPAAKKAKKPAAKKSSAKKKGGAKKASAKKAGKKTAKAGKKAAKPAAKKAKKAVKKVKKPRGRGGAGNPAFMKPLQPDDALAAVVGSDPLPRTQVIKKIWAYIKSNKLQDGQQINTDETLKKLWGKGKIHMKELPGLTFKHLSG